MNLSVKRTNGEAAMVCERRPVTEKKNVDGARSDGCRDEVAGSRSAGATIAAGQNRRVGSLLLEEIPFQRELMVTTMVALAFLEINNY